MRYLKNKDILLFLDYDGTLAPIAPTPDKANISPNMYRILIGLSHNPLIKTWIITGRAFQDIKTRIDVDNIGLATNHGVIITGYGINFIHPKINENKELIYSIYQKLKVTMADISGVVLEYKKDVSIAVHYRLCTEDEIDMMNSRFYDIIRLYHDNLKLIAGKKVIEIMPNILWDKGGAVEYIFNKLGGLIVYIGDDTTDEPAFKWIRKSNKGIAIIVTQDIEKESHAEYYLQNVSDVEKFLEVLMELQYPV